jgi:hypothetical protein
MFVYQPPFCRFLPRSLGAPAAQGAACSPGRLAAEVRLCPWAFSFVLLLPSWDPRGFGPALL